MSTIPQTTQNVAIIGAGMAGITCANTLVQAGHSVTIFEKTRDLGGRMATRDSAFGSFDPGAQYFTVRESRFMQALEATPDVCKRWSANTIHVLDELGRVTAADRSPESHWVAVPSMKSLVSSWAATQKIEMQTRVTQVERDALAPQRWQFRTESSHATRQVFSGFDAVVLAMPSSQAQQLLPNSIQSEVWCKQLDLVVVAPCWTLMLAFPQAMQPDLSALGPQWNAARSTHHRIAWLARESSKPGRGTIERWTVQASSAWSQEHLQDDSARVEAKLCKAFAEVTGIRAEPAHVESQRWLDAKTLHPLGQSHLWDAQNGLGVCGDWCLGHRVEDAFISGLELALAIIN